MLADTLKRYWWMTLLRGVFWTNRDAEAERQVKAAVEADGGVAEAHELWGYLLAEKGDVDGAVRELRIALRLRPDLGLAQQLLQKLTH